MNNRKNHFLHIFTLGLAGLFVAGLIYPLAAKADTTGDIIIKRVGYDLTTATAPSGSLAGLDTVSALTATNPAYLYGQSINTGYDTHTYYANYVTGYAVQAGTCTFYRGDTECTVSSFSSVTCDFNTNICTYNPPSGLGSGYVQKVVWLYSAAQSGDLYVNLVGSNLATSTAPAQSYIRVDSNAQVNQTSQYVANVSLNTHLIYVPYITSTTMNVGVCEYARGSAECTPNNLNQISCDAGQTNCSKNISNGNSGYGSSYCDSIAGLCTIQVQFNAYYDANNVMKVIVAYQQAATGNGTNTNLGDVVVSRVGADNQTQSAPAGTTITYDTNTAISQNPARYNDQSTGSHTYKTSNASGYYVDIGTCTYTRGSTECIPSGYQAVSSIASNVNSGNTYRTDQLTYNSTSQLYTANNGYASLQANQVTKVAFKYLPLTQDVQIQRLGSDNTTATAPTSGTMYLDSNTPQSTSIVSYSGISGFADHTYSATAVAGYTIQVGTCSYPKGSAQCVPTGFDSNQFTNQNNNYYWYYGGINGCTDQVCTYDPGINYQPGMVYMVAFKYVPTNLISSVMVKRVGADDSTQSAPAGGSIKFDVNQATSTNPVSYTFTQSNTYGFSAPLINGYYLDVAYCSYQIGSSPCIPNSYQGFQDSNSVTNNINSGVYYNTSRLSYDSSTGLYKANFSLYANSNNGYGYGQGNQTYIVIFKYIPTNISTVNNGTVDIRTKVIGTDLTTATAPAGVSTKVDNVTATTQNPYTFTSLSANNDHTVYATFLPGYTITIDYCDYQRGGPECTVTFSNYYQVQSYDPASPTSLCDPYKALCAENVGRPSQDQVRKVAIKYTPGSVIATQPSGRYGDMKMKAVGPDLYTSSAPAGVRLSVDGFTSVSINPYVFQNLDEGNHRVYATYIPGYTVSYGVCTYPRGGSECSVTSFGEISVGTGINSCDPNQGLCNYSYQDTSHCPTCVAYNQVTKVVFLYTPVSQTASQYSPGSYVIQRVGSDQTTLSAPPSTVAKLDSLATSNANPAIYTNVSPGSHTFYTTALSGYTVNFLTCHFNPSTSQDCQPTIISIYNYQSTCDSNYCSNTLDTSGYSSTEVVKVAFTYVPNDTNDIYIQVVGTDGTVATAPSANIQLDSLAATTSKQVWYYSQTPSYSRTFTLSGVSGYTPTLLGCSNDRGDIACVPVTLGYGGVYTYNSNANTYTFTLSAGTANKVYRYSVQYIPNSNADIQIKVVNSDEGSPIVGVTTQVDSLTATSSNPSYYSNVAAGINHTVTATFLPTSQYNTLDIGLCSYQRGKSECTPTYTNYNYYQSNANPAQTVSSNCNSSTGKCTYTFSVNSNNYIYKVVFRYSNADVATAPTGQTGNLKIKVVGADLYTSSAPANVSVWYDTNSQTTVNPVTYTNVSTTTQHAVYATYLPGYTVSVGICRYNIGSSECTIDTYSTHSLTMSGIDYYSSGLFCDPNQGYCEVNISDSARQSGFYGWTTVPGTVIQPGQVTKVVFIYQPGPNGDFLIKSVGSDLDTSTAPQTVTVAVDSPLNVSAQNPSLFQSLPVGSHTVYAKYIPGYQISVATCSYQRGDSQCIVGGFGTQGLTCDQSAGICTYKQADYGTWWGAYYTNSYIADGLVSKVVFKYDPILSQGYTIATGGDIGLAPGSTATTSVIATTNGGAQDQLVSFGLNGLPTGVVASFSPVSCTTSCSSVLTIFVPNTVPNGTYPITVVGTPNNVTSQFNLNVGTSVVINAYSVTCDSLSYLPAWGGPTGTFPVNRPSQITALTAQSYVAQSNGHCSLDSNWAFQWGYDGVSPSAGDFIGATSSSAWTAFSTQSGGTIPAVATIAMLNNTGKIWVRENLKTGYLPFTMPSWSTFITPSAGLYCNKDGYNYDNFDSIVNPQPGTTYNCVAFNAPSSGSGSIEVYEVDSNLNGTTSAAITSTVDSSSKVSTSYSPAYFTNLTLGSHTVSTSNITGYDVQVATCSYPSGGSECTVSANSFNQTPACSPGGYCPPPLTPTCSGATCSVSVPAASGQVTKVVFKYAASINNKPPAQVSCFVSPSNPALNQTVTWTALVSQQGTYTYSWSGTDGLTGTTASVSKSYSTSGSKSAVVTVGGDYTGTSSCRVIVGSQSQQSQFIEF